jgi:hypothetical protein
MRRTAEGHGRLKISISGREAFQAASLAFAYDPAVIKPVAVEPALRTSQALLSWNADARGRLRIALAGARPLRARGSVVSIDFELLQDALPYRGLVVNGVEIDPAP